MIHTARAQKVEDLWGMIDHLDAGCSLAIENPQGIHGKTPQTVLAEMIFFSSQKIV
jgi:hypothetical protein